MIFPVTDPVPFVMAFENFLRIPLIFSTILWYLCLMLLFVAFFLHFSAAYTWWQLLFIMQQHFIWFLWTKKMFIFSRTGTIKTCHCFSNEPILHWSDCTEVLAFINFEDWTVTFLCTIGSHVYFRWMFSFCKRMRISTSSQGRLLFFCDCMTFCWPALLGFLKQRN